jgi:hypothetical protein
LNLAPSRIVYFELNAGKPGRRQEIEEGLRLIHGQKGQQRRKKGKVHSVRISKALGTNKSMRNSAEVRSTTWRAKEAQRARLTQ